MTTTKIVATTCLVNQLCRSRLFETIQFTYETQSDISDTILQSFKREFYYCACTKHYAAMHLENKTLVAPSVKVAII